MFKQTPIRIMKGTLLAGILAGGILVSGAAAQTSAGPTAAKPTVTASQSAGPAAQAGSTAPQPATPLVASAAAPAHSRYHHERFSRNAALHYGLVWGVDSLSVRWTESGKVIRFSYRVLDAEKARALNDKKAEPGLFDKRAGVKLVVPSLEKVGQLRQSSTPVAGKIYWMAFSNKGRPVKRGDHVDVVIGKFRAEGLIVD
jgi:hypothetical protein